MTSDEVLQILRSQADATNVLGMARFGISTHNALGIGIPSLRWLAKQTSPDHALALELWESGVREARILAAYVDRAPWVTREQMDGWVGEFDSWDVCDQVCGNLFDRTPFAWEKASEWSEREQEFVRRAGFVLMASLAVHDKRAPDEAFLGFLPLIEQGAGDERNFVKKAVNWALRQIGKRNPALHASAMAVARQLAQSRDPVSRWVGKDALRELERKKVARTHLRGDRVPPER